MYVHSYRNERGEGFFLKKKKLLLSNENASPPLHTFYQRKERKKKGTKGGGNKQTNKQKKKKKKLNFVCMYVVHIWWGGGKKKTKKKMEALSLVNGIINYLILCRIIIYFALDIVMYIVCICNVHTIQCLLRTVQYKNVSFFAYCIVQYITYI